jgi:ribosomal-protein-alanine N-acetyltransferase
VTRYTIERMIPEQDLDLIVAIEAASFSNPWSRQMFDWEVQHSDVSRLYVLRTPEHPVAAFCSCWLVCDELHINIVAVRPELRRMGLATALLHRVLQEAAAAGARRATLEVRRSNEAALRLYQRLGFSVATTRRDYYTQPVEDALILWREGLGGFGQKNTGSRP